MESNPKRQEIGHEEEIHGRADHWLPAGSGIGPGGGRAVPTAWLLGGELLPVEMGASEVEAFLTHLIAERKASAS